MDRQTLSEPRPDFPASLTSAQAADQCAPYSALLAAAKPLAAREVYAILGPPLYEGDQN